MRTACVLAPTGKATEYLLRRRWLTRLAGYMEVDVDCNSSPAAGRIVSLVKSYARSLVVDLSFVIEAQTADELPERVIGSARMQHIDLSEQAVPTITSEERDASGSV